MNTQLLRDEDLFPSDDLLQQHLGNSYIAYKEFMKIIMNEEYALNPEWDFYIDGRAWLCKIYFKKKTIVWLSVWDNLFKISFYFTENHLEEIAALDIKESIKSDFAQSKAIGRLIPLIIEITDIEQLPDALTLIRLKKSLK